MTSLENIQNLVLQYYQVHTEKGFSTHKDIHPDSISTLENDPLFINNAKVDS